LASTWQYAARGWGGFVDLRDDDTDMAASLVGHFDGDTRADVVYWNTNLRLQIAPAARNPTHVLSLGPLR
jgi:hypothetical protein